MVSVTCSCFTSRVLNKIQDNHKPCALGHLRAEMFKPDNDWHALPGFSEKYA